MGLPVLRGAVVVDTKVKEMPEPGSTVELEAVTGVELELAGMVKLYPRGRADLELALGLQLMRKR